MWRLVPAADPGPVSDQSHRLLVGVNYVVGRKNCAILIQDDSSISRSHAVLSVSHPQMSLSQCSVLPLLTLKDTSKYGTFVNEEKMPSGSTRSLTSGDRVTFGVFGSKYRVEYEPLVVCSSCLDVSQKSVLNKNILELGGHVVNEWKAECTHLAMVSVKVTVKTICALICGRPITKPEYFDELMKAIQAKQRLPKPESFYPPVDEPSIKSEKLDLAMCPGRKTIFRGKTFVFLTAKQHAKLSPAVTLGGGEAKLMTEGMEDASCLVAPDVCVVDVGVTNSQASVLELERKWIDTILDDLKRKKYRPISEAEIGLAVIFVSTEMYCNPQSQLESGAKPASSSSVVPGPSLSQNAVVDETVMPAISDYLTAYVADTEAEQQMDTCMEVTGKKRNKEFSLKEQRGKSYQDDLTSVKETPGVNMGPALSRLNKRSGVDSNSLALSPSRLSGSGRNRERDSQRQSNSITNYFQRATPKRERTEEEETSVPKHAKIEDRSRTQPISLSLWENNTEGSQRGQCSLSQETSQSCIDPSRKSVAETSKLETTATENIPAGQSASKKRKELDDLTDEDSASLELVFASKELDWDEDRKERGEGSLSGVKKKRKLENEGAQEPLDLQLGNAGDVKAKRLSQETTKTPLALNQKREIKEESSDCTRNDSNNPEKLASDSSNLPSRLLLTEFRSLVVSRPKRDGCATKADYGHVNNFKRFKKVDYPGAGQLPLIIGGSDLVAAHARKNSEMEEWLRQEMEEQNRHAREESLADDLFRYDPHVKRR
ncbi:nibrin isoform X2 [Tiliqua scincoides]|uniref:nibrin isoform X2 n=1 Tax=Tiliqua scincoides TaxID=71010 RepID=UPI0034635362